MASLGWKWLTVIRQMSIAVPKERTILIRYVCLNVFHIVVPIFFQGRNEELKARALNAMLCLCVFTVSQNVTLQVFLLKIARCIHRMTTVYCHYDLFTAIFFFISHVIALSWSAKSWRVKK
jgi:hypothetical protein